MALHGEKLVVKEPDRWTRTISINSYITKICDKKGD